MGGRRVSLGLVGRCYCCWYKGDVRAGRRVRLVLKGWCC